MGIRKEIAQNFELVYTFTVYLFTMGEPRFSMNGPARPVTLAALTKKALSMDEWIQLLKHISIGYIPR